MGRESLQGSSVHGASLAPRTRGARHFARQRGAGTLEYMLISGFMLGALLTPFGEDDENALQRLLNAIRGQQDAYNYAAKLPVMPTFDADGKLVGGDAPTQEEPGDEGGGLEQPTPPAEESDGEGDNGDDAAEDDPDGGSGSDVPGNDGSDAQDEASGDDADNGQAGHQGGSEGGGGGSSGGIRRDIEDTLVQVATTAAAGYATWEFTTAVGSYLCGQLDLQNANPNWTQEDLWAYEAAKDAYNSTWENSEASFLARGIPYPDFDEIGGFSATLYEKEDGTKILAFRGSDMDFSSWEEAGKTADDWLANNIKQAVTGSAEQYDMAVDLAILVKEELEGEEFLITGHSLGGGLAQAASYATGMDAITFNGAGVRGGYKEDEEGESLSPGRLRNHFIYGDILTSLQALPLIPDSDGTQIGHSASCDLDPLQRHFMDSFAPPESPGRERPEELQAMAYHSRTKALFEPRRT